MDAWIAGAVFLVAYVAIATERFDRTLVALLGGLCLVVLGVIDQQEAFEAIDFNVVFLLTGMMVLAHGLARTGFFEAVALYAARISRAEPFRLLVLLALATALLSALLDNVTTVVLIVPVTLSITRTLAVSPVPYLVSQILASNIGGTATLIGDPPNIMIGSAAGLDFADFLANMAPVAILILVAFLVTLRVAFRGELVADPLRRGEVLAQRPADSIHDRSLLVRALIVSGATLLGFLVHPILGVEASTIALLGATVLMIVGPLEPHRALASVEWSTIFFFVGLFMLVGAIVNAGLVSGVADAIAQAADRRLAVAALALLWVSAIASAVVDNIPYTAAAIPVVERLVADGVRAEPLWWSLALGACLGGNLTIVGASANIVVANLAARADTPIRFLEFFRYGAIVVAESLVIASTYVYLRYLS